MNRLVTRAPPAMQPANSGLTWKNHLRRLIVLTDVGLIHWLYLLLYRAAAAAGGFLLGHCSGSVAVYLCRGVGKNEISPGVSDIDFIVVVSDDPGLQQPVHRCFRFLQIISAGVIPYSPAFLFTRAQLLAAWKNSPLWRSRLHEGRVNWQLVHGVNVLDELPPLSRQEHRSACLGEINYWWVQFCHFVLLHPAFRRDTILRNSICYKAVAELLNAQHAIDTEVDCHSRHDALVRASSPLTRKLLASKENRHIDDDPSIQEETCRFLMETMIAIWAECDTEPALKANPSERLSVDIESFDIDTLRSLPTYRSLAAAGLDFRLVRSAGWDLTDVLLIVEVGSLPTLAQMAHMVELRDRIFANEDVVPWLFIRIGSIALPVTPVIPRDFHRGILTPATFPEVFLQLGCPTQH